MRAAKEKAVRFVEKVLEDTDRAAEMEAESLESCAERKGFEITDNPNGRQRGEKSKMGKTVTKSDLAQTTDLLDKSLKRGLEVRVGIEPTNKGFAERASIS